MTLNQLQKKIAKLIEEGYGGRRVSVDKSSFRHNCETDGCVILPVEGVAVAWINDIDDDGGLAFNKDGSERGRTTVILYGGANEITAYKSQDQPTGVACPECGSVDPVDKDGHSAGCSRQAEQ